jgi:cytochrome c oxidase subunit 2
MELLNELIKAFSFPELVSQGGGKVDGLVIAVHLLMLCLFVGWIIYYFVALWKFRSSRNPKADYKGVKSKTITNSVEGGIIVAELILVVVATYFWNFYVNAADDYDKVAAMANGSKRDLHVVRVTAEQFGWNARYPGPNGRLGKQDKKLVGGDNPFGLTYGIDGEDDIAVLKDDIVVPMIYNYVVENPGKTEFKIGELLTETEFDDAKVKFGANSFEAIKDGSIRSVTIDLTSKDVIHCFKVLPLRVCQDAIPGLNIPIHFKPSKIGRYTLTCAQLCGDGHALMRGIVKVVSEQEWNQWQKTESEKNGSKKQQASVSSSDEKA